NVCLFAASPTNTPAFGNIRQRNQSFELEVIIMDISAEYSGTTASCTSPGDTTAVLIELRTRIPSFTMSAAPQPLGIAAPPGGTVATTVNITPTDTTYPPGDISLQTTTGQPVGVT